MNSTISFPPCPTALSDEQVAQYWREGYLVFTDVLSAAEVDETKAALSELVQRVANCAAPERKGAFWNLPGSRFGIQFEAGYVPNGDEPDLELKVRKLMWYCDEHPRLHEFVYRHRKIQGVLESILGESPILFQDMALIKPPFIGSEKPWHQDDAYFAVTPIEMICGVWIALDEATVENGCMHVLPGGHLNGPLKHYHDRDCEIRPDRLQRAEIETRTVPVPLPPGGGMFFSGLLPHQTPPNSSPDRRRAVQWHYRAATTQFISQDEYNRVFVETDGTPASCAAASKGL
jgi:phytanoyl-CoA hydroxylase